MNATLTGWISLLHVVEPSVRSVSNHLSSPWGQCLFSAVRLTAEHGRCRLHRSRDQWRQSGFTLTRGLAATTGRIEFVIILRTKRSCRIALHPLSRGRSYRPLQGLDITALARTCTLPIQRAHRRTSAAIHRRVFDAQRATQRKQR